MKVINFIYEYDTPYGYLMQNFYKEDLPELFLSILEGNVPNLKYNIAKSNKKNYKGVYFEYSYILRLLKLYSDKYIYNKNKNTVKFKHISEVTYGTNELNILLIPCNNLNTIENEIVRNYLKLDNLSGTTVYHLKNTSNFYLWFLDIAEGSYDISSKFKEKIDNFLKFHKIPKYKFIYTNCDNFIHKKNKNINYFGINPYITMGANETNKDIFGNKVQSVFEEDIDKTKLRRLKFLSYNRNSSRLHRLLLVSRLYNDGILNASLVSLYENDFFNDLSNIRNQNNFEGLYFSENNFVLMEKTIKEIYPLHLDFDNQQDAARADSFLSDKNHFLDTYFSIVAETSISNEYCFVTEKCIRPILGFHPFIVFGNPYTLRTLKEYGIKTFSDIIDESYDEELDTNKRFEMAYREVLKLNEIPIEELHKKYINVLHKLKHNKDLIISFKSSDKLVTDMLKGLIENAKKKLL